MQIAHHIAASRYAKWHRWLGVTAAVLAAIVGTSIFATFTDDLREVSKGAVVALPVVIAVLDMEVWKQDDRPIVALRYTRGGNERREWNTLCEH